MELVENVFYYYIHTKVQRNTLEIPSHIAPIIYKIHGIYLEKIQKNKKYKTTKNVIRNYIYSLDTALVYFLLTKQKKLFVKSDEADNN